jgi:hypothetical protein
MNERSSFGKQFSTLLQKTNVTVENVNSSRYDHSSIIENNESQNMKAAEEKKDCTKDSPGFDNQQSLASSLSSFLHIDGNFAESTCDDLSERSLYLNKDKNTEHSNFSHPPIIPPSLPFYGYYESQHLNPSHSTRSIPIINLLPSDIERFELEERHFLSVIVPLKKEEFEKDPIKQFFVSKAFERTDENASNLKGRTDREETKGIVVKSNLLSTHKKVLDELLANMK